MLQLIMATPGMAADAKSRDLTGDYVLANGSKLWYGSEGKGQPLVLIAGGPGGSHLYLYPYFSRAIVKFGVRELIRRRSCRVDISG
jgi:hypothetical protein